MIELGHPVVREAVLDDAQAIARVHVDSWRETYSGVLDNQFFSEAVRNRRADFWTRYLSMDPRPGRLTGADQDGTVIGFANTGASTGPEAEHGFTPARAVTLFCLYLLASAHGSGVGRLLLDSVLDQGPAQLWVLQGNARATAFYRRNGFEFDGAEFADPRDTNLIELRMVR